MRALAARLLPIVCSLLLAAPALAQDAPASVDAPPPWLGRVLPAIVKVYGAGGFQGVPAYGTGVVVDERGFVLTAWSIALRTEALKVVTHEGRRLPAVVWRADPGLGVALLKVNAADAALSALRLGDASGLAPGDAVWALGNPFDVIYGDELPALAGGVVTAIGSPRAQGKEVLRLPERLERIIVTDVPSNPGTQGGPLLDREGRLVGITGRIVESRQTNTIINFAIGSADLAPLVQEGVAATKPRPEPPRPRQPRAEGLGPETGLRLQRVHLARPPMAYVESVVAGSPAEKAGLQADDLVFRLGGRTIRTCRDFDEALAGRRPGEAVVVVVKRGTEMLQVTLVLAAPAKAGE